MDELVVTEAPRAEAATPSPAEGAAREDAPAIFAFDGWGMIPLALGAD